MSGINARMGRTAKSKREPKSKDIADMTVRCAGSTTYLEHIHKT